MARATLAMAIATYICRSGLKVGLMTWKSGLLGSHFGGLSGSYPQTKLSGCDPDITCSKEHVISGSHPDNLVCK